MPRKTNGRNSLFCINNCFQLLEYKYFTRTIHMIVRYLHENFIETTVPYTCTCIFTSDKKLLVLYLVDRENTSTVQSLEIGFVPGR